MPVTTDLESPPVPDSRRPASVRRLIERFYPTADRWNPTLPYWARVEDTLRPDAVVLDVGAGAGVKGRKYDFRGRVGRMIGVDPDPRVADNHLLDEGLVLTPPDYRLPVEDASVDVAFSTWVLEHVEDPAVFLGEVTRVLKPGGRFCAVTPNRRHYVPLVARLTPTWFHKRMNRQLRSVAEEETFPTWYRLNTPAEVRRHAAAAGLEVVHVGLDECLPTYLCFAAPAFLAGVAYERAVNAVGPLKRFRCTLTVELRKPA